ncbi:GOLPH3/VPS74 family protein [Glycomyces harbinensis]|uniref:Golgi phosphoprotein 3 (GPP34) n=1 Tax=Glycomyces harbinensis TaxID=58114 RepID=A0A1G6QSJ1_9ACTN|nr:GPP34 family phosphoprotein [Glycomyces harbinensis]SDC94675.1 Golgi phosphoprotein 3 (GPP34) [Glycomyces harbinensis]
MESPTDGTSTLIVEDLLLLLLDDEKGYIAGEGTLYYPLGGAVLIELALDGHVRFEPAQRKFAAAKVHAVEGRPPSDPMLAEAYEVVAKKPRTAQELLILIGTKLRVPVADRLVERGLVRRNTKKVLGLFRSTSWPAADVRHEAELREQIEAVLVEGRDPDPRTGAVIALLAASGQMQQVLEYPELSWTALGKRADAIIEGNWAAEAVKDAIVATNAAIVAVTTGTVVSIVTQ